MTHDTGTETQATDVLPITRFTAKLCYLLFTILWVAIPLLLIPLVINLLRRGRARGTWLESHFRWQVSTFLIAFAAMVIMGVLTYAVAIFDLFYILGHPTDSHDPQQGMAGMGLGMLAVLAWYLYRMIKGWIILGKDQAIG